MRPRIAIPADTLTEATNIINERNAAYAPRPLIEAIVKSGGLPVIFPSVDPELIPNYLDLFDGIIFAGGSDVDPTFYGEEPHQELGSTYFKRDLFEVALVKAALEANKALMGNLSRNASNQCCSRWNCFSRLIRRSAANPKALPKCSGKLSVPPC